MKKIFFLFLLAALVPATKLCAQSTIPVDPKAGFGVWSEWRHDTVKGDDGKIYTYDYRQQIAKRKGMAVYYQIEIKNTCAYTLSGRINFHYTTTWLQTAMSEDEHFKVKAGQSTVVEYIQQGCKKTDKNQGDYEACVTCPMEYTIYIRTK